MPDVRIPATSEVLYSHPVEAAEDPTDLPVFLAVKLHILGEPALDEYKIAAWLAEGGVYNAVIMIGQAGTGVGVLAPGIYRSWARVIATPEKPVLESKNFIVIGRPT